METPVGWPRDLVDPHDLEFVEQARAWILDRLPGEFRQSPIANEPHALAWILTRSVHAENAAYREMYATARGELESGRIEETLAALELVGSAQLRLEREADLVRRALVRASGENRPPRLD